MLHDVNYRTNTETLLSVEAMCQDVVGCEEKRNKIAWPGTSLPGGEDEKLTIQQP